MLWKVWAAVGAIVCGIGVATLLGDGVPPQAKLILGAALLVGVVLTVVERSFKGRRRQPKAERRPRWERDPVPDDDVALVDEGNRELIDQMEGLVRQSDVDWLRTETFDSSWRDVQVEPFRELARFEPGRSGIADPALKASVDRLTRAARAFVDLYEGNTTADPIMPDATWRVVGQPGATEEADVLVEIDPIGERDQLRAAAAEICASYVALAGVSRARAASD